jgi:hypothetical protein
MNIDQIIAYEQGELDEDQIIEMFQEGINSGMVYQLQGSYGRMAQRLIEAGYCQPRQAAQAVEA